MFLIFSISLRPIPGVPSLEGRVTLWREPAHLWNLSVCGQTHVEHCLATTYGSPRYAVPEESPLRVSSFCFPDDVCRPLVLSERAGRRLSRVCFQYTGPHRPWYLRTCIMNSRFRQRRRLVFPAEKFGLEVFAKTAGSFL